MKEEEGKKNYTYILTCADGTYYCGWTNDLDKRLAAHNQGKGAKYTKPRRPVILSYWEAFDTKEEAMRREWAIKRLSRKEKERLMDHAPQNVCENRPGQSVMQQNGTSSHNGRDCRP